MEPDGPQPPSRGEAAAASAEEPRPCAAETAPCPAEMPPGPEAGLQAAATHAVELPPCHGVPGPYLGELPAADLQPPPLRAPEPPGEVPARGKCLMRNWQEERATNDLDRVPRPEYGTEGFFYRHGHPGLLTLEFLAGVAKSTTMKDSYSWPVKTGLPVRGKREAMMEHLLYLKHSPMTTSWSNHRHSGLNMPSRCRALPAAGLATPLSRSAPHSQHLSPNTSASPCRTTRRTIPSCRNRLAAIRASGKAPSLGRRGQEFEGV
ncbi:sperm-associated antigen 8 [Liasis olivaceus]